jgi:hypothetical protein
LQGLRELRSAEEVWRARGREAATPAAAPSETVEEGRS